MRILFLLLFSFSILLSFQARSQKSENSFNADFVVGGNIGDTNETMLYLSLGHEWKPFPFLGAELNVSYGSLNYGNEWEEIDERSNAYNRRYNYESINCTYETINTKINGYLNILYTDDDKPSVFLFASFTMGVAAIQTKGALKTFEDEELEATLHYDPHFYTGVDIGVGAQIFDSFRMTAAIGGSTIKFDNTAIKLNQKNSDFPLQFKSSYIEPAIRLSITYMLKYRKEK